MNFCKYRVKSRRAATAIYAVRTAAMAAMLTAAKFALSFVPNVEIVTLLILVYGSAMGIVYALPAALVFCAVEVAIYGIGSWAPLYFVYWSLLAALAGLTLKGRRLWLALLLGGVGSVLFGVLSASVDTLFCLGSLAPSLAGKYWVAFYLRGIYFDAAHVISSIVTVAALYMPLVAVMKKIAPVTANVSHRRMRKYQFDEYAREKFSP